MVSEGDQINTPVKAAKRKSYRFCAVCSLFGEALAGHAALYRDGLSVSADQPVRPLAIYPMARPLRDHLHLGGRRGVHAGEP